MPQSSDKIAAARDALFARTPRSREAAARAAEVLPLEIAGTVEMPYTVYIESSDGAHVVDLDGNRYIDLTMGFGPHLLGHSPAIVREAIKRQADRGWHYGIHSALQERLARLVVEASPCADSVVFCNSGTEATMYALRVARAFTGKPRIATFEGAYHGAHDYVLIQADRKSPRSEPAGKPRGRGIPPGAAQSVMILPYRDANAFELIERHRDELAAVMIEPVQSSNPRLDNREFLHSLADACRKNGVLFILDEVISGFRIAYGGCQEYYDLVPDLAAYGKTIGGGLPVGAIAGRRDVMSLFTPKPGTNAIFSGGTFSGNPLTMAAGVAAIEHIRDRRREIYPYLAEQGNRFAAAINAHCREQGIPAQLMNAASIFMLHFQREPIESARDISGALAPAARAFDLHLLNHGVIIPGIHQAFFSMAHTPAIVDQVIDAFKQSFADVEEDGLFTRSRASA
jgi:glutamate-1-semialdehyde 2,1-aminomutase